MSVSMVLYPSTSPVAACQSLANCDVAVNCCAIFFPAPSVYNVYDAAWSADSP